MVDTKTQHSDEVCQDAEALRDKQKVMNKQWYNSLFYSVADTLKTIAGVLTPVGLAVVVPSLITGMKSGMGFGEALLAVDPTNLAIAGLSLAATVAAIGVSYVSSHYYHSANFDQTEVNSQHTAKYIVRELQKQKTHQHEHPENCRKDGKAWVKVVHVNLQPVEQQGRQQ